jgi:hypothetical protein
MLELDACANNIILYYPYLNIYFWCFTKSNLIWSKVDHMSTIESNTSSIRCCSHGYLMNFLKLTFILYSWKQNHIKFYLSGYIKILILNTSSSLLLWNYFIHAIRVYFGHFSLTFYSFLLSLSLGCGTHLSDKIITWMTPQEISLSRISWESPTQMRGDNRVILWNPCLNFLVGLIDLLRSLTTTFPDWWSLSSFFSSCFLISFIIYSYFFNVAYLNPSAQLLKYFKGKHQCKVNKMWRNLGQDWHMLKQQSRDTMSQDKLIQVEQIKSEVVVWYEVVAVVEGGVKLNHIVCSTNMLCALS